MKRSSNQVRDKKWLAIFVFPALSILLLVSCTNLITAQTLTKLNFGLFPQAGANDVGIIPQSSAGCPVGSEYITMSMDGEDNGSTGSVQGWTGDISYYPTGNSFGFCRVDGNQFDNHFQNNYAVLQLGSSCPAGSVSIQRLFDNENINNKNGSSGNTSPNTSFYYNQVNGTHDTLMNFCFFYAAFQGMQSFPEFHVPYGVFAAPASAWLATGVVRSDDEDKKNQDFTFSLTASTSVLFDFANIIYGADSGTPLQGRNSILLVAKVTRGAPCYNPCPYIGSYDSVNCWVGKPPSGTNAFIWSTNFYYSPVNGAQTPAQKCPMPGSWFDSVNCFVKAIPTGTKPFIYANMWYVEPDCRPVTPN